jgi:hypothetical protein
LSYPPSQRHCHVKAKARQHGSVLAVATNNLLPAMAPTLLLWWVATRSLSSSCQGQDEAPPWCAVHQNWWHCPPDPPTSNSSHPVVVVGHHTVFVVFASFEEPPRFAILPRRGDGGEIMAMAAAGSGGGGWQVHANRGPSHHAAEPNDYT